MCLLTVKTTMHLTDSVMRAANSKGQATTRFGAKCICCFVCVKTPLSHGGGLEPWHATDMLLMCAGLIIAMVPLVLPLLCF